MSQTNSISISLTKRNQLIDFEIVDEPYEFIRQEYKCKQLIQPYKNNEFIPVSIILQIVPLLLPSSEVLHHFSVEHLIIKTKIKDLLDAPIVNWEYNRPPDLVRCNDIAKYMYNSKQPIDTMFYVTFNNIKETFEIIDGVHRYTSLKMIQTENKKPLDLLCPGNYGNNNDAHWMMEQYVLVNMRFNQPLGAIIEIFRSLNKSNPVPDLYIRDVAKEKRTIIQNIANSWQIKYKDHFSANSKPNKPNVNRDRFIELLDYLYDKYKICEDNKQMLETLLENANQHIKRNLPNKLTPKCLEKCQSTDCYLFLHSLEKLEKMI